MGTPFTVSRLSMCWVMTFRMGFDCIGSSRADGRQLALTMRVETHNTIGGSQRTSARCVKHRHWNLLTVCTAISTSRTVWVCTFTERTVAMQCTRHVPGRGFLSRGIPWRRAPSVHERLDFGNESVFVHRVYGLGRVAVLPLKARFPPTRGGDDGTTFFTVSDNKPELTAFTKL
jgi:hypothetical protein